MKGLFSNATQRFNPVIIKVLKQLNPLVKFYSEQMLGIQHMKKLCFLQFMFTKDNP